MPKTLFLVRARGRRALAGEIRAIGIRADHLPWACRVFKCEKAWRGWSAVEEGVHYAVYEFADKAACDAALGAAEFKDLVADFIRIPGRRASPARAIS